MKAFIKTLFGDLRNFCVVAVLIGVAALLVHTGHASEATYAIPLLTMAAVSWLAFH